MIQTFKNKLLEKLLKQGSTKGIPKELEKRLRIRLAVIDSATTLDEIKIPGYDLHQLKGNRQGTWSIKLSGNWRITFRFEGGNAQDVDIEDYH